MAVCSESLQAVGGRLVGVAARCGHVVGVAACCGHVDRAAAGCGYVDRVAAGCRRPVSSSSVAAGCECRRTSRCRLWLSSSGSWRLVSSGQKSCRQWHPIRMNAGSGCLVRLTTGSVDHSGWKTRFRLHPIGQLTIGWTPWELWTRLQAICPCLVSTTCAVATMTLVLCSVLCPGTVAILTLVSLSSCAQALAIAAPPSCCIRLLSMASAQSACSSSGTAPRPAVTRRRPLTGSWTRLTGRRQVP